MRSCGIITIPCCSSIRTQSNRRRTTPRRGGGGGSRRSRASAFVRPRPCSARRSTCRHHAMETKGMENWKRWRWTTNSNQKTGEWQPRRGRGTGAGTRTGKEMEEGKKKGPAQRDDGRACPPPPAAAWRRRRRRSPLGLLWRASATTLHRRPSARRTTCLDQRARGRAVRVFVHTRRTVPARSRRPTAARRRNRRFLARARARSARRRHSKRARSRRRSHRRRALSLGWWSKR